MQGPPDLVRDGGCCWHAPRNTEWVLPKVPVGLAPQSRAGLCIPSRGNLSKDERGDWEGGISFFLPGSQTKLLTQDAICFGGGSCERNNTGTSRPVQNPREEGQDVQETVRRLLHCVVVLGCREWSSAAALETHSVVRRLRKRKIGVCLTQEG